MNLNPNRKHALAVLSFLVVVAVGDRVGGYLLDRVFHSTKFRFAQIYSGELPADVVFIGNSRGVHMFHRPPLEELTGQEIANLSFNGMPASVMPTIFADYLQHHPAPKQLFVEVSCVGRQNEPGSLERFTVLSSTSSSFDEVLDEQNPVAAWCTKLSHLYRYNSELFLRSLLFRNQSDQDWIMESTVDKNWEQGFQHRNFVQSSADVDAIRRLMRIAADHDIEVKLLLAPYLPEYASQLNSIAPWLSWLSEELKTPIADYSAAIQERDSFADPIHLNPIGARRLAIEMIKRGEISSK